MRVLKFIGLKVAEIGGALMIAYWCGVVYRIYTPFRNESYAMTCFMGLLFLLCIILSLMLLGSLGWFIIKLNWKWSK